MTGLDFTIYMVRRSLKNSNLNLLHQKNRINGKDKSFSKD